MPVKNLIKRQVVSPRQWRLLRDARPRVNVSFERGHFTVKTIATNREVLQALKLRYEVFHREFMGKRFPIGIDKDRFDAVCDHLAIIDNRTGKLIGTYRLMSSAFTTSFYSESEFHLGGLLQVPGVKLELGRACIHKDYRNGMVINLLWRGIVEYARAIGARYLFGCTSLKTMAMNDACAAYQFLAQNDAISDEYRISPTADYRMPGFAASLSAYTPDIGEDHNKELIPSLLKVYLKAGAKVCGEPALDRDFKCIDLFTVLDLQSLTKSFERKYI